MVEHTPSTPESIPEREARIIKEAMTQRAQKAVITDTGLTIPLRPGITAILHVSDALRPPYVVSYEVHETYNLTRPPSIEDLSSLTGVLPYLDHIPQDLRAQFRVALKSELERKYILLSDLLNELD